jgi:amino acid adenylation domain-containing protein
MHLDIPKKNFCRKERTHSYNRQSFTQLCPKHLLEMVPILLQANYNPVANLHKHAVENPGGLALWINNVSYSYGELARQAAGIAAWLHQNRTGPLKRVAVMATRNIESYLGIMGSCWAGASYVPLNPNFPENHLLTIIAQAEPDFLITDPTCLPLLTPALLDSVRNRVLLLEGDSLTLYSRPAEKSAAILLEELPMTAPAEVLPDSEAYLVFTSGTTGQPNGVAISAGNLAFAIRAMQEQYHFTPTDRFSQFFELSFDFSVMDLFVPWQVGASTHVVPPRQRLGPGRFIIDRQLTVWTCVPSMISLMHEMKMLTPGIFTSLRFSCFSGMPLSTEAARSWQKAAPNSIVVNLYGQTEAPIGSMAYTYHADSLRTAETNYLPLGKPFAGVHTAIVDQNGKFAAPGVAGQLALSGPHVARGYLDPRKTSDKFRSIDHPRLGSRTWYLTGDLVRQDRDGTFHFLGRVDNEVKIGGHRIMLEEVERYLQEATGCNEVAAAVWHNHLGVPETLIGFAVTGKLDEPAIKRSLSDKLPQPLVPRRIFTIDTVPLNQNGKVDRKALEAIAGRELAKKADQDKS